MSYTRLTLLGECVLRIKCKYHAKQKNIIIGLVLTYFVVVEALSRSSHQLLCGFQGGFHIEFNGIDGAHGLFVQV